MFRPASLGVRGLWVIAESDESNVCLGQVCWEGVDAGCVEGKEAENGGGFHLVNISVEFDSDRAKTPVLVCAGSNASFERFRLGAFVGSSIDRLISRTLELFLLPPVIYSLRKAINTDNVFRR